MHMLGFSTPADPGAWPLVVLGISVVFIIVAITVLRLHAFVALLLAALLVGWLTPRGSLPGEMTTGEMAIYQAVWTNAPATGESILRELQQSNVSTNRFDEQLSLLLRKNILSVEKRGGTNFYRAKILPDAARKFRASNHAVETLEVAARDFGAAAGNIGIVIALAAIIGLGLMESGAADKIVRWFVRFFGEARASLALLVSGFLLSIPVFFDTVFFLLIPLARAMALRTGKNYMLYVMAMAGGGAITHSMVPPTPGPLLVADVLRIDLGVAITAGLISGLLPAVVVLFLSHWMDRTSPVALRETAGASIADLNAIVSRRDEELPAFGVAVLPVLLPALLIALASFFDMAGKQMPGFVNALGGSDAFRSGNAVVQFLGNKTFALLLGAVIAMGLHLRFQRLSLTALGEKLAPALETAGVIILITSAGGAFGAMIRHSGVGEVIKEWAADKSVNFVLLAWLVTAIVRIAQGSATVAMITGSALMFAVIGDGSILPYHPVYIFLAVGFGSIICSWMNDSGFWVVGKLSGFTEKETLKSWTVLLTAISVVGLIETLLFAWLLPFKG